MPEQREIRKAIQIALVDVYLAQTEAERAAARIRLKEAVKLLPPEERNSPSMRRLLD